MNLTTAAAAAIASRPCEGEQDLRQMQTMLMEARARTDDWRYPHVGELTWAFFMVVCHLDPWRHIRLWCRAEGQLVGYATLGEDPSFDCRVMPESQWSGIEAEALAWAEALLAELRRRDARRWRGPLVCVAREEDARHIAFLERHGFRRRGEFAGVDLLRSLSEALPEMVVPAGCRVRAVAGGGDVADRAAAQREVWQPWTVGNVGEHDYATLMQLPGYQRRLDVVALAPDGVIAA